MLQEIKRFVEGLEQLPTVSPVALKLISVASDPDVGMREVAGLLKSDQSLASKILRLANSAAFGFSGRVATLERATSLLGLQLVRSAALSVIVIDLFRDEEDSEFRMADFWRHSLTCALASEALAERTGHAQPKEAFLAGLLHDIGKLVLLKWDRRRYSQVLREARRGGEPLLEAEERLLGAGHTWVAKILMTHWRFPEEIRDAAWLHHQPASQFGDDPCRHLSFLVGCADRLCHHFRFGASGNSVSLGEMDPLASCLGLTIKDLVGISANVLRNYDEVAEQFDWTGGDSAELCLGTVARANQQLTEIHLELEARNAELRRRQRMMEAIRELQETVNPPASRGGAMESAAELLVRVLPCRSLTALAVSAERKGFEGSLKEGDSTKRIELRLGPRESGELKGLPQRQQVAVIIEALGEQAEDSQAARRILKALGSPDLLVVPLKSGDQILGQVFAEIAPDGPEREETVELLRLFARSAAVCLERLALFEQLDRQAERLTRVSRQEERARSRLSRSERLASVGRLAAGAAHEINNPLTIISAQAQLLFSRSESKRDRKALGDILGQSERIAKIVRDLMGLARPAKPQAETVRLGDVVESSLQTLQPRLASANVKVECEIDKDAPEVRGDPRQLEQVFVNLGVNAMQAMKGGGRLGIRIRPQGGQAVHVEFSDSGSGISEKHLHSIFDPFFSTKGQGEGTGLGLAICSSIIQAHGGEITVSSRLGVGTTFRLVIPVDGCQDAGPVRERPAKIACLRPPDPRRHRVLIVDRERDLARILAQALRGRGYRADTACDRSSALEQVSRNDYSAVVVDLRLEGREDGELLRRIGGLSPKARLVATSGSTAKDEFDSVAQLASACLRKPFPTERLVETVSRVLSESGNQPLPFSGHRASA